MALIDRLGLDECDLCHEICPVKCIRYTGKQFLCTKCDQSNATTPSASAGFSATPALPSNMLRTGSDMASGSGL